MHLKHIAFGLMIVIAFGASAIAISNIDMVKTRGLSPIVIGIVISMVCGNFYPDYNSK